MRQFQSWICVGLPVLVAAAFVPVDRLRSICAYCHLGRADTTCFGLTTSSYRENECSRWYPSRVEPAHDHLWQRGTCRSRGNILGFVFEVGCSRGRPILRVTPALHRAIYEHFDPPTAAKPLFESLTRDARRGDDPDGFLDGYRMVDELEAWSAAGFPGRWTDRRAGVEAVERIRP